MAIEVEFESELDGWPDVAFTLSVPSGLTADQRADLEDVLVSWYVVGFFGGFGPPDYPNTRGAFHYMVEPTFEETVDGGLNVHWRVDAGGAPQRVLDALVRMLELWSENFGELTLTMR